MCHETARHYKNILRNLTLIMVNVKHFLAKKPAPSNLGQTVKHSVAWCKA